MLGAWFASPSLPIAALQNGASGFHATASRASCRLSCRRPPRRTPRSSGAFRQCPRPRRQKTGAAEQSPRSKIRASAARAGRLRPWARSRAPGVSLPAFRPSRIMVRPLSALLSAALTPNNTGFVQLSMQQLSELSLRRARPRMVALRKTTPPHPSAPSLLRPLRRGLRRRQPRDCAGLARHWAAHRDARLLPLHVGRQLAPPVRYLGPGGRLRACESDGLVERAVERVRDVGVAGRVRPSVRRRRSVVARVAGGSRPRRLRLVIGERTCRFSRCSSTRAAS